MIRTEQTLGAYEQLHPTICLLDKDDGLQESSVTSVKYGNQYL